jgi:hypothetical protein
MKAPRTIATMIAIQRYGDFGREAPALLRALLGIVAGLRLRLLLLLLLLHSWPGRRHSIPLIQRITLRLVGETEISHCQIFQFGPPCCVRFLPGFRVQL